MARVVSPNTGSSLRSRAGGQSNSVADMVGAGLDAYRGIKKEQAEQTRLAKEDARDEREHQLLVRREDRLLEQMDREDARADKRLALDEKKMGHDARKSEAEARIREAELRILQEDRAQEEQDEQIFREAAEQVYLYSQDPNTGMSPMDALQVVRKMSPGAAKMFSDSMLEEANVLDKYAEIESSKIDAEQKRFDLEHDRSMAPIEFELENAKVRREELMGDEVAFGNVIEKIAADNAQRMNTAQNALIVKLENRDISPQEFVEEYAKTGFRSGETVDVEFIANANYVALPEMLEDYESLKTVQTELSKFQAYQRPFVFAGMVRAASKGGEEGEKMLNVFKHTMDMTDKQIKQAIKWYETAAKGYVGDSVSMFPDWQEAASELFTIEGFNKGMADTEASIGLARMRIKDALSAAQGPHDRIVIETNPEGEQNVTRTIYNPDGTPKTAPDKMTFEELYGPP